MEVLVVSERGCYVREGLKIDGGHGSCNRNICVVLTRENGIKPILTTTEVY